MKKVKKTILSALQIPEEIVGHTVLIRATGRDEVCLENYKGIVACSDARVVLQGADCQVVVEGRGLCMEYYTCEIMKITGCIDSISYR